jgi:hypothetical protein
MSELLGVMRAAPFGLAVVGRSASSVHCARAGAMSAAVALRCLRSRFDSVRLYVGSLVKGAW